MICPMNHVMNYELYYIILYDVTSFATLQHYIVKGLTQKVDEDNLPSQRCCANLGLSCTYFINPHWDPDGENQVNQCCEVMS